MDHDINKQFADLAKKVWEEKKIRIDRVLFDWNDVGLIDRKDIILESVETNQRSYHS